MDVVIPSYNGRELLSKLIPNLARVGLADSVIVVDDASTDGSADFVRSQFPGIKIIVRAHNGGFSAAVNDGIRATDSEFVLVLNNDVELTEGFLAPLLTVFAESDVFAVSPKILLGGWDGVDDGAKSAVWHHGMIYADHLQGVSEVKSVFFVSGCAALYRRSMLNELRGFDEAYAPFYWEDVDLSYRAWKRGWKSVYQPASRVAHVHSATISSLCRAYVDSIKTRNNLLFLWRNVEDKSLVRQHRIWLPLVLAKRVFSRDFAFLRGFLLARPKYSEALRFREEDSKYRVMSDKEIFEITGVRTT